MRALQGKGWLIVGALLAVLIPWVGADQRLTEALARLLPFPWRDFLTGLLILLACSAFYFRAHWAAVVDQLNSERRDAAAAAEVLRDVAIDLERSASVLEENLVQAIRAPESATGKLYLDGAVTHSRHLGVLAQRSRTAIRRLEPGDNGQDGGDGEE